MSKVDYEFKIDKSGRKYALKVDTQTGKKKRIKYTLAKKRARDLVYRRKRAAIEQKLKETGSTATYKEYLVSSKVVRKDIIERREKKELPPLKPSALKARTKKETIEHRSGIATRLRYAWVYRIVVGRYFDEAVGEDVVECDTSIFRARAVKRNGDEFAKMVRVCKTAHEKIQALDLCSLDGGACVILYNKSDKSIIKQFELGKGCGFSFDFSNYNHDELEEDDGYGWI